MKNLSLILASLVLFTGASFANPVVKASKQEKQKTEKKETKKTEKKETKKTDKKAGTKTDKK
jgi:hypothetical protein